jgi:prepilin-type N-terminal cleavage/methylation domain-containing protein/prepilin-type processing-associated H-X9-DG protein
MRGELENQSSLTLAALSTCGCPKSKILSVPLADRRRAFTLVELAVVLGMFAVLASVAVCWSAGSKSSGRGFQCISNMRTLMAGNLMYQFDNQDRFPRNDHDGLVFQPGNWVRGWMDWSSSTDNTNLANLVDPSSATLAAYVGREARVFKCTGDVYTSPAQQAKGWTSRVRSVSANVYVGESNGWGLWSGYKGASKSSDLVIPGPARTWVYTEEHPDSINDGCFWVPRQSGEIVDAPGTYHNGAAAIAMADGHSEMHRWRGPTMNKPRSQGGLLGVGYASANSYSTVPGDPDVYWLSFGTPRNSSQVIR